MAQPRVLITGFGRFPGAPANPTAALARALARRRRPALDGLQRRALVLPTLWDAPASLAAELDRQAPDIVLMLGLAARRRHICVETLALNAARAFPDAARRQPGARRLDPAGAAAFRCAAAPMPLLRALRLAGVPARGSRDAGRYVCNALAYAAYRRAQASGRPRLAVFVHVPLPGVKLTQARMLQALEALLVALAAQLRGTRAPASR